MQPCIRSVKHARKRSGFVECFRSCAWRCALILCMYMDAANDEQARSRRDLPSTTRPSWTIIIWNLSTKHQLLAKRHHGITAPSAWKTPEDLERHFSRRRLWAAWAQGLWGSQPTQLRRPLPIQLLFFSQQLVRRDATLACVSLAWSACS